MAKTFIKDSEYDMKKVVTPKVAEEEGRKLVGNIRWYERTLVREKRRQPGPKITLGQSCTKGNHGENGLFKAGLEVKDYADLAKENDGLRLENEHLQRFLVDSSEQMQASVDYWRNSYIALGKILISVWGIAQDHQTGLSLAAYYRTK